MSSEVWQPSEQEMRSGLEGYMRYLGGVAVINDPASDFASDLHRRAITPENIDTILIQAERLMYEGLKTVIAFSNPPESRRLVFAESHFEAALPAMRATIDKAYEGETQIRRIDRINVAFYALRPAPVTKEPIYRAICHGRLMKLSAIRLLDGLLPAEYFEDALRGRSLMHLQRRHAA